MFLPLNYVTGDLVERHAHEVVRENEEGTGCNRTLGNEGLQIRLCRHVVVVVDPVNGPGRRGVPDDLADIRAGAKDRDMPVLIAEALPMLVNVGQVIVDK